MNGMQLIRDGQREYIRTWIERHRYPSSHTLKQIIQETNLAEEDAQKEWEDRLISNAESAIAFASDPEDLKAEWPELYTIVSRIRSIRNALGAIQKMSPTRGTLDPRRAREYLHQDFRHAGMQYMDISEQLGNDPWAQVRSQVCGQLLLGLAKMRWAPDRLCALCWRNARLKSKYCRIHAKTDGCRNEHERGRRILDRMDSNILEIRDDLDRYLSSALEESASIENRVWRTGIREALRIYPDVTRALGKRRVRILLRAPTWERAAAVLREDLDREYAGASFVVWVRKLELADVWLQFEKRRYVRTSGLAGRIGHIKKSEPALNRAQIADRLECTRSAVTKTVKANPWLQELFAP